MAYKRFCAIGAGRKNNHYAATSLSIQQTNKYEYQTFDNFSIPFLFIHIIWAIKRGNKVFDY
jgi:hypothetical protein